MADFPGVTRDRQYGRGVLGGIPYLVVDTGGIAEASQSGNGQTGRETGPPGHRRSRQNTIYGGCSGGIDRRQYHDRRTAPRSSKKSRVGGQIKSTVWTRTSSPANSIN